MAEFPGAGRDGREIRFIFSADTGDLVLGLATAEQTARQAGEGMAEAFGRKTANAALKAGEAVEDATGKIADGMASAISKADLFKSQFDRVRDLAGRVAGAVGGFFNRAARHSDDLASSIGQLQENVTDLEREALQPLAPTLTLITDRTRDWLQSLEDGGGVREFSAGAAEGIAELRRIWVLSVETIGGVTRVVFDEVREQFDTVRVVGTAMSRAIRGDFAGAGEVLSGAFDLARNNAADLTDRLREVSEAAKQEAAAAYLELTEGIRDTSEATDDLTDDLRNQVAVVDELEKKELKFFREVAKAAQDSFDKRAELRNQERAERLAAHEKQLQLIQQEEAARAQGSSNAIGTFQTFANASIQLNNLMGQAVQQQLEKEGADRKENALKAFRVQKALNLANAISGTALAIVNAASMQPFLPLGLAASIAAGALGAVQIGLIASQQPPQVAHLGAEVRARTSDEVPLIARRGEYVVTQQGQQNLGGREAVAAANAGHPVSSGGAVTVFKVGNRAVDAMVSNNVRRRQGPLTEAIRREQPRSVAGYNPAARV